MIFNGYPTYIVTNLQMRKNLLREDHYHLRVHVQSPLVKFCLALLRLGFEQVERITFGMPKFKFHFLVLLICILLKICFVALNLITVQNSDNK